MAMILNISLAYAVSCRIPNAFKHNRLPDIKIGKIKGVANIDISEACSLALAEIKATKVNIAQIPIMLITNVIAKIIQSTGGILKNRCKSNRLKALNTMIMSVLNKSFEK